MGKPKPSPQQDVRFVSYITLKNGKRLYAWQVGKRAFPIPVNRATETKDPKKSGDSEA